MVLHQVKIASNGGTSVEGLGFAIPSNDAQNIIKQLESNGKVTRPALGIQMVNRQMSELVILENLTFQVASLQV